MRVCLPISGNPSLPKASGIHSFIIGLSDHMCARGIPVELLSAGGDSDGRGPKVTSIASEGSGEFGFSRRLAKYLRRGTFPDDTVFVVNAELHAWAFRRFRRKPPLVLILHGPTYPTLRWRRPVTAFVFVHLVERKAVSLVSRLVAIDSESREYIVTKYPGTPVEQVPLPVDTVHFQPVGRQEAKQKWMIPDQPALLFIGRLAPEKNPEFLLKVFRGVKASIPRAVLLVAGAGPLAHVFGEAKVAGDPDSIRMLGIVPKRELASLYSAADAIVIPSHVEQLPTVMLESLACGTQVFSTDVGDVRSVIGDSRLGLVLPADATIFAREIITRIPEEDKVRRQYLSFRRSVAARFSWELLGPRFLETFRQALLS